MPVMFMNSKETTNSENYKKKIFNFINTINHYSVILLSHYLLSQILTVKDGITFILLN